MISSMQGRVCSLSRNRLAMLCDVVITSQGACAVNRIPEQSTAMMLVKESRKVWWSSTIFKGKVMLNGMRSRNSLSCSE